MSAETEKLMVKDLKDQILSKTIEEQKDLAKKLILAKEKEDEQSIKFYREILMRCNIGLVIHLADKYQFKGVEFGDLLQEGFEGLLHAIDLYDPEQDVALSTYAWPWIQSRMCLAVTRSFFTVSVADWMQEYMVRVWRAESELSPEYGMEGKDIPDHIIAQRTKLTPEKVHEVRSLMNLRGTVDSDSLTSDDDQRHDSEELLFVVSEGSSQIGGIDSAEERGLELHSILTDERRKCLLTALKKHLSEKEYFFATRRWGLKEDGSQGEMMSLAEVGRRFEELQIPGGVTREYMRQMEHKILEKLRGYTDIKEWAAYFDEQYTEL